MNAEFNWWLLIVGLVVGAGLTWLVVADSTRREADLGERERADEALWIATTMTDAGQPLDTARVAEVLRLHRDYLAAPPPDEPDEAAVPGGAFRADEPGKLEPGSSAWAWRRDGGRDDEDFVEPPAAAGSDDAPTTTRR